MQRVGAVLCQQMRRKAALQEPPESVGGGKMGTGAGERQEADAVHRHERHVETHRRGYYHARQEERRGIVSHDHADGGGQRFQQLFSFPLVVFDLG